jgi:uncharacterized membrane protein YeaQ/YmgE (transglycosylase-associated protein family)
MSFVTVVVVLALQGLVVGGFARLALPGRDPMSILQTIGLGLAGTFIAGIVVWVLTDGAAAPSFLIALFFAVLLVYLVRRRRGGGLSDPGRSFET